MFERIGCVISAFFMYFTGCTSVYLVSAISFERWVKCFEFRNNKTRKTGNIETIKNPKL